MASRCDIPLSRFAHALDEPIQRFLAAFLERLGDRLGSLLMVGKFEKSVKKMIHGHSAMLLRPVLKNWPNQQTRRGTMRMKAYYVGCSTSPIGSWPPP
jgi:hypothetical protein